MASSGYTAITFTANEQPTTAKWNLIGSNDASFNNGNGFEDNIIITRHIADQNVTAQKLLSDAEAHGYIQIKSGSNSAQSSLAVSSIPEYDRLRVIVRFAPSTSMQPSIRFNSDSGNNYSHSHSLDMAAPTGASGQNAWLPTGTTGVANWVMLIDIINLPSLIKSMVMNGMSGVAGGTPNIRFAVGTWNNTSNRITRIDLIASTGNLGTASIVVLGLGKA